MVKASVSSAPLIGVSPAFFISRYGDRFSAHQVADALDDVAGLGCQGFQLEVYHRESLNQWLTRGARMVRQRSDDANLQATQFVAHFLMESFSTPEHLNADTAYGQMMQVLEIVEHFDECRTITIPIGPFFAPAALSFDDYQRLLERCVIKIGGLLEIVEMSRCRLALELIPGGLIAGSDGFLRLCDLLSSPTLGFNLDTGHAWAAKENLYLLPAKLGARILGTHICDNLGLENCSLRPGAGSIEWPRMIAALSASGYHGPYDLEIICPSHEVQSEYLRGISVVSELLRTEAAAA